MSDLTCRTTTFINTVRNEWVGHPYRVCKFTDAEFGPERARKMRRSSNRAKREIARLTKKLKIDFRNNGQRVVSRGAFRYWKDSGSASTEFAKQGESITFGTNGYTTRYRLRLRKKPIRSAKCESMLFDQPAKVMSLRMRNLSTNQSTPLQVDRRLPKTRGCPFHYRIQNAYMHKRGHGNVVVVLLQYFSPSIEGPNEQYLAVSGRMN